MGRILHDQKYAYLGFEADRKLRFFEWLITFGDKKMKALLINTFYFHSESIFNKFQSLM